MKLLIHSLTSTGQPLKFRNGSIIYPHPRGQWFKNKLSTLQLKILFRRGFLIKSHNFDNHLPSKLWDDITHPFPNFNSCTIDWEWISNFIHLWGFHCLSMIGLHLIRVSKSGPSHLVGCLSQWVYTLPWQSRIMSRAVFGWLYPKGLNCFETSFPYLEYGCHFLHVFKPTLWVVFYVTT